jgi:coenzyme F420 hydrogenase subunit beta
MSNNIQDISDSYLCSSCGACKAICPKDCIHFHFTPIGRKEAQVGPECIDCGLCRKVCPTVDTYHLYDRYEDRLVGKIDKIYVGRATDPSIYANSQSGGAATAILKYLFETGKIDGALVCEMSYGSTPVVQGKLISSVTELASSQKSCYTPVDLLSSLRDATSFQSLAVVGLPCQIEGVENLVQTSQRFGHIKYKLGLICDRTLCAGIQDYLAWKYQPSEFKIEWRKKDFVQGGKYYSYQKAPMVINPRDGELRIVSRNVRKALKDMYTSPRCRVCYDKLNTHSDITLGDPWGMQHVDWEHGDSLIITRTELGRKVVD